MPGMPGSKVGPVPILQMYGVSMEGNSILCHIHGYVPYFYIPAPTGFNENQCGVFQDALNKAVLTDMRSNKDNISQVIMVVGFYEISIVSKASSLLFGTHCNLWMPLDKHVIHMNQRFKSIQH